MAKKGSTTKTTNVSDIDPATKAYLDQYRKAALNNQATAGQANPYQAAAGGAFSRAAGSLDFAGQTGLGGLDAYMNPYEDQVVGGIQSDFDRQRGIVDRAAGDQATRAGAFGGSREAVLRANAMGDVNRNESSTLAGVRQTGFNDAASRLQADRAQAAQLGIFGAQGMYGLGNQLDQDKLASLYALQGASSPYTTTQTQTQRTPGSGLGGFLAGGLGGVLKGMKYGPWGMAIGGAAGALGS